MRSLITVILLLVSVVGYSQVKSFDGTFSDAINKAKKENKMVMLMTNPTWMQKYSNIEKEVLNDPMVSEFLGDKFIYLASNLSVEDKDNLAERYDIMRFPQFLIFNSDGQELNRFMGSVVKSSDNFIELVERSIEPGKTFVDYDNMLKSEPSMALTYAVKLKELYLNNKAQAVTDFYFSSLAKSSRYTKDNVDFYTTMLNNSDSEIFNSLISKRGAKRAIKEMGEDRYISLVHQFSDALCVKEVFTRQTDTIAVGKFIEIARENEVTHTPLVKFAIDNIHLIVTESPEILAKMAEAAKTMSEADIMQLLRILSVVNASSVVLYKDSIISLYSTAIRKCTNKQTQAALVYTLRYFNSIK